MAKKSPGPTKRDATPEGVRIPRTLAFPVDQDLWLSQTLGEKGNLSGFIQGLVTMAMEGRIDVTEALKNQKDQSALHRAAKYLKAKEASMMFEEDVGAALTKWLGGRRGLRISRARVHNGGGTTFVADFTIERENGEVVCSVNCKSSPRADRLQLALAEAMIGNQKTGKPVVTVVPYLVEEATTVAEQFRLVGYVLTDLKGCPNALDKVTR